MEKKKIFLNYRIITKIITIMEITISQVARDYWAGLATAAIKSIQIQLFSMIFSSFFILLDLN